ncbi:MAG TPA: thiamine pyrophosphate-binding protein [Dehalococcoidia bacterium]|nr:thiamine pyrophosphate-binding protein [Dehalococcoidia bacterium]
MAEIDGATLIARSLKTQGVDYAFGIVGIPVSPIASAMQRAGIKYLGMRHEQSAAYAAGAVGYLTGRPGACLVVSGPGMTNAISGMGNAQANCWPMLCLAGANDSYQMGMGAFQEAPQMLAAAPWVKYQAQPESTARLPFYIEQAVRYSISGRPGPAYLDLMGDVISGSVDEDAVKHYPRVPDPPRTLADPANVVAAIDALKTAQNPLVIVGKGAAYARAEADVQKFIETTQLPFLASPMGKGVIPDDHPLSVGAARSYALQNADLVFLIGARLNWIMHFGLPPRFRPDVRVVQMDIAAEEIGRNVPAEVALVGDAKAVTGQLNQYLEEHPWQYPAETTWRTGIEKKIQENVAGNAELMNDDSVPMGYYRALKEIRDMLPRDAMIVSEGASTMDIGRQVLNNYLPRHRLDAGTWGTMGVGLAFAIAAQVVHPEKRVVDIEGDAAFGFSGMEVEVACRHNLPITFIVFNNNGIGGGPDDPERARMVPGAYIPDARYERVIEAFGGLGIYVEQPRDLQPAIKRAFEHGGPSLINVKISNQARRRPQQFAWLTR